MKKAYKVCSRGHVFYEKNCEVCLPGRYKDNAQKNGVKTFTEKVLEIVKKIPKGKVMTYGQVAKGAGNKNASRAVGMIMSKNKIPEIPCHRVVASGGKISGYNGINKNKLSNHEQIEMKDTKMELLKEEGVKFSKDGKAIFNFKP